MYIGLFTRLLILPGVIGTMCGYSVDPEGKPVEPFMGPTVLGPMSACPFFSDQPVCCQRSQDDSMLRDFKALDATFGSDGGGCDL